MLIRHYLLCHCFINFKRCSIGVSHKAQGMCARGWVLICRLAGGLCYLCSAIKGRIADLQPQDANEELGGGFQWVSFSSGECIFCSLLSWKKKKGMKGQNKEVGRQLCGKSS